MTLRCRTLSGFAIAVAAFGSLAAALPAAAQAFGREDQDLWVGAFQFQGKLSNPQDDLTYDSDYYARNPGSSNPQRYFSPLSLPSGALITQLDCYVNDASAANDVEVQLQRSTHDVSNDTFDTVAVGDASSTGTSGYQLVSIPLNEPVLYTDGNNRNLYALTANLADDTSLRSCRVVWHRTVSPAPAAATFSDVPTNHPFFRFIEALASAGITGGCGAGVYCPDNPVTRGQMAAFLSIALGLHFPQ